MEKELMSNLYHKDIYDFDNPVKSYWEANTNTCLLYTSPSPRDAHESRMPSSA